MTKASRTRAVWRYLWELDARARGTLRMEPAATLMPVLASPAVGLAIHPYGIMIAGATAASFAFTLPAATPPSAVVFGSGYITMPQMVRAGFRLDGFGVVLIVVLAMTWLPIA